MTGCKIPLIAALSLLLLSSCGSDGQVDPAYTAVTTTVSGMISSTKKAPPPGPITTRASLDKFNTPMILAELPAKSFFTFVVPYARNQDVETWASTDDKTISFRQGVVVATRGFGPDIMQAATPNISQIAAASGTHDRSYYYVDGGDQTLRRDFRCTLSNLGSDTVTVVDRQHTTRHVTESCTGDSGSFTNEYWFENGTFLRKSKQLLIAEWGYLVLSRVIDNG
jgi:hypothetical protein